MSRDFAMNKTIEPPSLYQILQCKWNFVCCTLENVRHIPMIIRLCNLF